MDAQHWKQIRAQGWWRFVLLHGTLKLGAIMLFTLTIVVPYLSNKPLVFDSYTLLIQAAIYGAIGFAYGMIIWRLRERLYPTSDSSDQANKP